MRKPGARSPPTPPSPPKTVSVLGKLGPIVGLKPVGASVIRAGARRACGNHNNISAVIHKSFRLPLPSIPPIDRVRQFALPQLPVLVAVHPHAPDIACPCECMTAGETPPSTYRSE